ncbi:MAG: ABC transporter ATP-binding protein, partial [Lachnospiraceae bacterium]|nr:ABC transporter ATP-binding protein [Lachnospiraceae bacterium]
WQAQKELQAKARKKEDDLRKCEDAMTSLEQELSDIESTMSQPDVATDVAKLQELTKRQQDLNEKLLPLYEQWEILLNE